MQKSESLFEIELKALLTEEQYRSLSIQLPKKFKQINQEDIHTTRYRPGDVRLRNSDKTLELVTKEGDVTHIARREVKIPLPSKETLEHMAQALDMLGFKSDPPWFKHKKEFEYNFNGFTYVICLQHIEKFAYLLEVEHLSEIDDSKLHEPNIRRIMSELGCEPINPQDFSNRVKEYIKQNSIS